MPELKLGKKDLKKEADKAVAAKGTEKSSAQILGEGMVNVKDIIAPSAIEIDFSHIKVGNTFYKTFFVSGYPRFVGANWLSPIINFDHTLDISMFYYPVKAKGVMEDLRKKITEMEATMMANREKGRINDPTVSIALDDAKALQEQLVKGVEKFFQFSFYITIPADSLEELNNIASKLEATLGSLLLISKVAALQMEEAFQSSIPCAMDKLLITRNMDTTSLATTFPFTSSDLTMDEGIMYGINRHNGSLIIFDRFSMENANTVVFAKSGSGKSYFVKLEALRSMVFGAEILIIDVEEEYKPLCEAVGGNFISFSSNSPQKINPFDLSGIAVEGENELGQKVLSLHTMFKLMLGVLTPTEEAILDRALIETYRIKGITTDPETQRNMEPPVMEDLYKVLLGAEEPEARSMAERLEKFIKGSMAGIFDSQSSIKFDSKMTVFSTKNLEDTLRPIAFYIILDFVWTRIRKELKKRILIVEEAWYLMQNEDSARFIYSIAKRARKYYLGLTTISQDVDDFLTSEYGKAIVTNSSIQVLLKQHPAAIDKVADTFYLSEGEKRLLLSADRGEGLFFAGANHVAIKVMASPAEDKLVTTNPAELLKLKQEAMQKANPAAAANSGRPVYTQAQRFDPDKYSTMDSAGKVLPQYAVGGGGVNGSVNGSSFGGNVNGGGMSSGSNTIQKPGFSQTQRPQINQTLAQPTPPQARPVMSTPQVVQNPAADPSRPQVQQPTAMQAPYVPRPQAQPQQQVQQSQPMNSPAQPYVPKPMYIPPVSTQPASTTSAITGTRTPNGGSPTSNPSGPTNGNGNFGVGSGGSTSGTNSGGFGGNGGSSNGGGAQTINPVAVRPVSQTSTIQPIPNFNTQPVQPSPQQPTYPTSTPQSPQVPQAQQRPQVAPLPTSSGPAPRQGDINLGPNNNGRPVQGDLQDLR